MKIQESAEDYLEAILVLSKFNENNLVRAVDVAAYLEFSKPSVSVAMKALREDGLIEGDPRSPIRLTEQGLILAEKVLERHRVLSDMLVELGVSEENALRDACRMEHILSQESFDRIREHFVGHRSTDFSKERT